VLRRLPRGVVVALAVCLALAVVIATVVAVRWWREGPRTDLARAVSLAPASTERLSWTDWRAVRREVEADLGTSPSVDAVTELLDDAFSRDLSTSSALAESSPTLQAEFGFSPATIDWELFAQGPEGAVEILGFPDETDFDAIGETLTSLGFTRADGEEEIWAGGADVLARVGPQLTPQLQFFALLPDMGVILTSDTLAYLKDAVAAATGAADHLTSVSQVVSDLTAPLTAAVYTGSYACEELAMASADERDRAQAVELVRSAGEVHPLSEFAMAAHPDGHISVTMAFESDEVARTDADTRATLASGPAPGQGGDFADRFSVDSVSAEGRLVRMRLDPIEGEYVLSDLTSGPLLFATC
jgi:hypothetical protein